MTHATGRERGAVSVSGIVFLLFLVCGIFLAIKLVPPYIGNYQLQKSMQDLALTTTYSPISQEDIAKAVIARAQGYGIVLAPIQVKVHKEVKSVSISTEYSVPVDLMVRQVVLHFEPSAANIRP